MNESVLNGILIFSILQAVLFSLLSFARKKKSLPDLLIGSWMCLLAVQAIFIFFIHNNLVTGIFTLFPVILTLAYGPLQFFYVYVICSGDTKIKLKGLLHFVPFLVALITAILLSISEMYIKILAISSSISGLTYCFITLYILRKHSMNIRNRFSFTEKINLSWLNKLVFGLLLLWSGVAVLVFLRRIFSFNLSLEWFYTAIPVFIFYIGFNGIKQQVIYPFYINVLEPAGLTAKHKKAGSAKKGYRKSGLQNIQMQAIHDKMVNAMQVGNLFMNPDLSLQEMSDTLKIPSHHITQTLNEFTSQNFYDFVNGYRVDEFKKRVEKGDADSFSLLGIAFDCGFNSKSSFNRIFKNTTGQTPSGYRIKHV
jgi:AraC-like DNA-binding protein